MTRTSSQTIRYSDLTAWVKKQTDYARQRKESAVGRGVTNQEALSHDVRCGEALVRMLERCEPFKRADMYELFKEVKK